jgi:hypothetical protein
LLKISDGPGPLILPVHWIKKRRVVEAVIRISENSDKGRDTYDEERQGAYLLGLGMTEFLVVSYYSIEKKGAKVLICLSRIHII